MAASVIAAEQGSARSRGREAARRAWPSVAAGAVLAVVLLRMAFDAGGFFPAAYLGAGTIAFAACAVLLAAARPRYALSTQALAALSALGGLGLWAGLSSLWSAAPSDAIAVMQRDLTYLALLGLGILASGSGRYARRILWLGLAIVGVICGAALLARLFPGLIDEGPVALTRYRLSYPLTYWNALGGLAAMGAVLAFGLAADPRTRWELRGLAGAASVLLVVTMSLSLSRGAWLAFFAGLVVLVALGAHRGSLVLTGAVVGAGWFLAVARLQAYPALTDDPLAASGQAAAGRAFAVQLAVICLAVAAVLVFVAAARASDAVMERLDRAFRPLVAGAAVLVALVVVFGYAARSDQVEGRATTTADRVSNFIDRQWDDFLAPAGRTAAVTGSARVTAGSGGSRSEVYRVALGLFGDHPVEGAGAGSFKVHWLAERPIGESVVNAHSLELESLAELGVVGGVLLLAFLGAIVSAAVRSRRKPGALPTSQVAAVGGACAVWIVHSALDWDWQMPAVTGVFLLLACTLFPYGRRKRRRRRRRRTRAQPA